MKLIHGQHDLVANWVAINLGVTIRPPYVAIGATRDGLTLCAGVVFTNWNGSNMDISLYGPDGIGREALGGIYQYAFLDAKANRLTAITKRSNSMMKKHLPKLGFQLECVSKRWFGLGKENDGFRYVLFQEAAERWMK